MNYHYRVKFISGGELHYGVVDSYSEEAKNLALDDKLLIEDAVLPKCWIVPEADISDVPRSKGVDEYEAYVDQVWNVTKQASDTVSGCSIGKLIRFSIADGYAYYVVAKVNKKTVKLQWRGFSLDRYIEPVLGWEGTMDRSRCEAIIQQEERMWNLFGKK